MFKNILVEFCFIIIIYVNTIEQNMQCSIKKDVDMRDIL